MSIDLLLELYGSINDRYCTPGDYNEPLVMFGKQYDRAVRISDFKILIKKGIGSVDIEEKQIKFENGIKCDYNKFNSFSASDGFLFWESYFNNPLCSQSREYIPIFQGPAT